MKTIYQFASEAAPKKLGVLGQLVGLIVENVQAVLQEAFNELLKASGIADFRAKVDRLTKFTSKIGEVWTALVGDPEKFVSNLLNGIAIGFKMFIVVPSEGKEGAVVEP